ncbi:BgTH12-02777 [Blumeria graminis f. sp. triticale]|uniref:BgTH12-02777 n=1 Tax=Blumeria graminis f. sp. triticale TaxID=1689686 RepID=A0A9W4GFS1_BLUGR|nr:BgTH12-02777 [Blumeria graminis f. sp. triticale]
MFEPSNSATRPEKGKAPARLDTHSPVDSTNDTPKPEPDSFALTPGEKFVKVAWPKALVAHEINHEAYTRKNSKVVIWPDLCLNKANSTVFLKLAEIQSALGIALVPYWYWPQRLCLEMKVDFQGTHVWAEEDPSTTWPLLLEDIFKTMQQLDVLHGPRTLFSRLSAKDGEDINPPLLESVTATITYLKPIEIVIQLATPLQTSQSPTYQMFGRFYSQQW